MSGTPGRSHHGQKMGTWDLPTYQPRKELGRSSLGTSRGRGGGRQVSTLSSQIAALRAANSAPLACHCCKNSNSACARRCQMILRWPT